MDQNTLKQAAAKKAIEYIVEDEVVGVGTGSTVNFFIEQLASFKHIIEGAVASSVATEDLLKKHGINVIELNNTMNIPVYIDGADEVNALKQMIKGGGGALAREKIVASASKKFVCIVDQSKQVDILAKKFPIPVEVLPMARSFVGREIRKLGGDPEYREGFTTDNGNVILDIYNLQVREPIKMEHALNQIPGVVCNGIFAERAADVVLIAGEDGSIGSL